MQFLVRYLNTDCFPVLTIIALRSLLVPSSTVIIFFSYKVVFQNDMTKKQERQPR